MSTSALTPVKALLFDVFGTCTDWRTTITHALTAAAAAALPAASPATRAAAATVHWPAFAEQWRDTYHAYCLAVARDPAIPLKPVSQHYHDALHELLAAHGLADLLDADAAAQLARQWRFLAPWPDVPAGIRAFNALGLRTVTLSNGDVPLLTDMAAHGGLEWSHIFSADLFGSFKPNPRVYLGAAERLGLRPDQCALVASHLNDLEAAKDCGLRTIYTGRPQEEQWDSQKVDATRKAGWVDMWLDIGEGDDGEFPEVAKRLKTLQSQ